MDIHLVLTHGPLEAEIQADHEDNYQQELLHILDFIEEYNDRLLELKPVKNEQSEAMSEQASMAQFANGDQSVSETGISEADSTTNQNNSEDESIVSLAQRVNTSQSELQNIISIDPSREEPPFIDVKMEDLGKNKTQRQFKTALILLTVWDDCYDKSRVKSSTLKDALEFSRVDSKNMYNIYNLDEADRCFKKGGRGASATIGLTRAGKRESYIQLQKLVS